MFKLENSKSQRQVYVILSVDAERDIPSKHKTKTAGWSKGNPLLFEVFDHLGLRGKVCWLLEYNAKDGIVAANPDSYFFVKEFPAQIEQIKNRGDELGLHPDISDWLGGGSNIPVHLYGKSSLWDHSRSHDDPDFVMQVITSAKREFMNACGVNPVGCRTGSFMYATHLAAALEKNDILVDSSVSRRLRNRVTAPNAYFAAADDIRHDGGVVTRVLEIPTTGGIGNGWKAPYLRFRSRRLLESREPIFLSFFMHNWQAVTSDGAVNTQYLRFLRSFLSLIASHGATFLGWTQAYNVHADIYGQTTSLSQILR